MEAAGKRIDELKAQGRKFNYTEDSFRGGCEWIDYTTLREELKYEKSGATSLSFSKGVVLVLSMMSLISVHSIL